MKFWDDTTPITNARIADAFRYSTSEVRIMEMRFLKGLDYSLSLSSEDVKMFIFEAAKVELTCMQTHRHTVVAKKIDTTASCSPMPLTSFAVGVVARV